MKCAVNFPVIFLKDIFQIHQLEMNHDVVALCSAPQHQFNVSFAISNRKGASINSTDHNCSLQFFPLATPKSII